MTGPTLTTSLSFSKYLLSIFLSYLYANMFQFHAPPPPILLMLPICVYLSIYLFPLKYQIQCNLNFKELPNLV